MRLFLPCGTVIVTNGIQDTIKNSLPFPYSVVLQITATTFSLSTLVTGNYLLVEAGKDHPSSLPPVAYYQGQKNNVGIK